MKSVFDGYSFKNLYCVWEFIKDIPLLVRRCHQRIHKGYCDRDVYCFSYWFQEIAPEMIEELNEMRNGFFLLDENGEQVADFETMSNVNNENESIYEERYSNLLSKIVYLFRESRDETCSMKNPYAEEHLKILSGFWDKYGIFGEKMESKENRKKGSVHMHSPEELPEEYPGFDELDKKYREYECKREEYMEQCLKEALDLFSKYFNMLVD